MVCLSGLADLDALLSGVGIMGGEAGRREGDGETGSSVSVDRLPPGSWLEDVFVVKEGLLGRIGRESSV